MIHVNLTYGSDHESIAKENSKPFTNRAKIHTKTKYRLAFFTPSMFLL